MNTTCGSLENRAVSRLSNNQKHHSLWAAMAAALVALLASAPVVLAGSYTWISGTNTVWATNLSARWSGTPALTANGPLADDDVTIDSNFQLRLEGNRAARTLTNLASDGKIFGGGGDFLSNTLTIGENVTIVAGSSLDIRRTSSGNALDVSVGGNLSVEGTLWLGSATASTIGPNSFAVTGSSSIGSGGRINNIVSSLNSNFGDLSLASGGSLVVLERATLTGNQTHSLSATVRSLAGTGTIYGSNFDGTGTRTATLNIATANSTNASFGGVLQDSDGATSGVNRLNVTLSGNGIQALAGTSSYTGQTLVSAGTLLVNGTHTQASNATGGGSASDGIYRVASGATLGGTGRIAARGSVSNTNMILVQSGGFLAPGASLGTLTLDGADISGSGSAILNMATGSQFNFELAGNGTDADRITFWNYSGAGDFLRSDNVINLSLIGAPSAGTHTVVLFDFFSNSGNTVTVSGIVDGLTLSGGTMDSNISSAILIFNQNNISLQYTVIPEPGTVSLLLGGALLIWRLRKIRKHPGLGH